MAELALTALGPAIEVAKLVANPIKRQLNYLCCFTANIDSLNDEARKLEDALAGLEAEVQTAKASLQEPFPEVETWLTNSNNIIVEINGIRNEATNVQSGCSKLRARFFLSRRAKKTTQRTEKLRGEKPEAKFLPPPIPAMQAVPLGKIFECESRKEIEEEIMTALRSGEVNKIGIWGMGGLGKTTMAKKIMNRVLNEHVFEEVVIATVSQNVDISKIQDEIGGQLGLDKVKEEKSQPARVKKLHSRLSNSKRTLLVLDDVWNALALENFGIPGDSEWCKILFTSRNHDALQRMDVEKIFGMKVLPEEEAWSFFRGKAGTCVDDMDLNPTAKEVAKECGGLPINLAAVGAGLKDEGREAIWKDTLRKLKQNVPDHVEYDRETYNPLKLSYEYLDSKPAQSIFLLCCLFPEDADIPLEYLTNFCMGLRLFEDDITTMEDARNSMCTETDTLKGRSLLLESDKKDCVRMHDVVRDVCRVIAKEKEYIGKDGCTRISSSHLIGQRNELLSGSRCPNLDLLFLDSRYDGLSGFKFEDAFLEGMRELRVLCIERYTLTTLPHPTQSLAKLHTLILESCKELKSISVVGEMVNLEILICRNCGWIEKLPSEMKGLYHLKVLELTGSYCQSIERGIISSLVALEELKMCGSFNEWEAEDRDERENASIKELEALPKLTCLEIDIHDPSLLTENLPRLSKKIVRFKIMYQEHKINRRYMEPSKALRLYLVRESCLGDWIEMQLLRDTEGLCLIGDGANNVDWAKCQNLRWLQLWRCGRMKNVDATVFPFLEHLELESLGRLEEVYDGPISSTSFQNLKTLGLNSLKALTQIWKSRSVCENNNNVPHFTNLSSIDIFDCHSLRNLGQLSMAGNDCLPQLQKLGISCCEMMEQVFLWNDEEEAGEIKNSIESQRKQIFPKLKEVELWNLPNLTTFYQGIEGIEFPLLTSMDIQKCPKMKSIIGSSSSSADIDEDASLHLFCQPQKVSFGSLEVLEIEDVGSMSLFTLSVAANLVSLRELYIRNCDEMIKVIEDEQQQERILQFPKLEIVKFEYLPKLVSFCDSKCEVKLPLLREVEIFRCRTMRNFSVGLVDTPHLEDFRTDLTTYVGVGVDVAFNSLKELMISKNEKPWYDDKISVSVFNVLEKLVFSGYKGSMSLFSSSSIENLVNLKQLHITRCNRIVQVIEDEEEDGKVVVSGGEIIRSVVFPKLEVLRLEDLQKLVRFCELKCDVELPSLTQVEIEKCPNMESFSMGFVAPNLKIVKIDGHEEIDAAKDLNGAVHQHYLARQEEIFRNKILQINHNPFFGHEIPSSAFDGLEVLTINEYEDSMSLFTLSVAANFVSLRKLWITYCDEMINVIEDEQQQERILVFPKLEELHLSGLPKLVSFCSSKCEVELPLLRKVYNCKCPNMENSSLGLVATPNLEAFTTDLSTYVGVGVDVAFNSLKKLKIFLNENPFDHHKISVSLFNGLEELEFDWFTSSMSLFSSSAVGNLANLRVLKMDFCRGTLVNVIEEDGKVVSGGEIRSTVVFPKLEELHLKWLRKLVRFCEWKCDVVLPSLTKLEIEKCPNMENFSTGCVAAPNLKTVQIDGKEIDATKDLNGALQQHYLANQEKENEE